MIMHMSELQDKVLGCWMGKNIGGTLGAPMEWRRQINDVTFYTEEHKGEPLPNDDLDIQLLWLIALEEQGLEVNERMLGDYWMTYVTPHWAEYGNAKVNMRSGLVPPLSGALNNVYKDSCGAFIRTEIWACMCAGNPARAAQYAVMDASIDHGFDGEGTYAAAFTAALEAAAFIISDPRALIDIGLSYIPENSAVRGAILTAIASYDSGRTWLEARDDVLKKYSSAPFFNNPATVSPEDTRKGFVNGPFGWEVPANMGMLIIGLLYGGGDFDKTICITVNCGEDTDCTGATVGSIFGILHGIKGIPERWIAPIGRGIKTITLDLGDLRPVAKDVDELTARTLRLTQQAALRYRSPLAISETLASDLSAADTAFLRGEKTRETLYGEGPRYNFNHFNIEAVYPDGPYAVSNQPVTVELRVKHARGIQGRVCVELLVPAGFSVVGPARMQSFISGPSWGMHIRPFSFTLIPEGTLPAVSRACAIVTVDGRADAMTVPIVLLGNEVRV